MPSINNLVATTETEALNVMLSAIGEAPVADIDAATQADVAMAKNILKRTAREVLGEGWRFNMEFGYELAPTATQPWVGSNGSSATLNVFEVPSNLVRFEVTQSPSQTGSRLVDVVARKGNTYDPTKLIFYDRLKNRDGLDASIYPVLYIDPVWYFDFSMCPESIRNYIAVVAARRLVKDAVGSESMVSFTAQDEAAALRLARRDQGEKDSYNMLNEWSVGASLGRRSYRGGGRLDYRASPRKV